MNIKDLIIDIENTIAIDFAEILECEHPSDRIHEIADNAVPIYNYDLAQALASDFSLAYPEDEGCVEGVTDVFKIISWCIYERLTAAAYWKFEELKQSEISRLEEHGDDLMNDMDLVIGALEELEGTDKYEAIELKLELEELEKKHADNFEAIELLEG